MAEIGIDAREIKFRMKMPLVVFFFKLPTHTTHEMISYLCSALLEVRHSDQ